MDIAPVAECKRRPGAAEECQRYRREVSSLHVAVLRGFASERAVEEGSTKVRVRVAAGAKAPATVDLRVAGHQVDAQMEGSELVFSVDTILDHEVAVIDWA
ncbi:MAG TPA: hypothetical protein VNX29_03715 [Kaistia sp.]|nr:hypothetical protein [Kaistia sp.]